MSPRRHVSPPARSSTTAPYNFVPLPNAVFQVASDQRFEVEVDGQARKVWECHDRFVPELLSGRLDLRLTLLTPLYIRGAVRWRGDAWDPRETRFRHEPFTRPDGRPAIPGSSLRGMLRNLVEILSFAKVAPVTTQRPFFRSVGTDRMAEEYRRLMAGTKKPAGGFLVRDGEDWAVQEAEVLRVEHGLLSGIGFRYSSNANSTPPWPPQHSDCWVRRGTGDVVTAIQLSDPGPCWTPGTLVLTGPAGTGKRNEFVFLVIPAATRGRQLKVPDGVWERFHDDDQVTNWQKKAYPRDRPAPGLRPAHGHLRDGEPVFFITDDAGDVRFLGRPQMFRLPYERSPQDLAVPRVPDADLDLAEVLFGTVRAGGGRAIKGRVRVGDAVATGNSPWGVGARMVPQILSSPKATSYQLYLTQNGPAGSRQLQTYFADDDSVIRGHKLYWHRPSAVGGASHATQDQILRELNQPGTITDTQVTVIAPVEAGTAFDGSIHFENLTTIELGALLHAIWLPVDCRHRLGMGKPLGCGSVELSMGRPHSPEAGPQRRQSGVAQRPARIWGHARPPSSELQHPAVLTLIDRGRRYEAWDDLGRQDKEAVDARIADCMSAFGDALVQHADASDETRLDARDGLWSIARLDVLRELLTYPGPPEESTGYGAFPGSFRSRGVLPTPHAVAGKPEPLWGDASATHPPSEPTPSEPNPPPPGPQPPRGGRQGDRGRRPPARRAPASTQGRKRPTDRAADLEVGQGVDCIAKVRGGRLIFVVVDNDRVDGKLSAGLQAPESTVDGSHVRLVIVKKLARNKVEFGLPDEDR